MSWYERPKRLHSYPHAVAAIMEHGLNTGRLRGAFSGDGTRLSAPNDPTSSDLFVAEQPTASTIGTKILEPKNLQGEAFT